VLGGFLTHAGPPPPGAVAGMATELNLESHRALEALAAADLVHSDPVSGAISVAYPYSGRPTPYRVQLDEGIEVRAMCALDALGIPLMTGRDTHQLHRPSQRPARHRRGPKRGLAVRAGDHDTDPEQALAYLQAHPGMSGEVLGPGDAVETARRYFGGLLDPQRRHAIDDNQDTKRCV
jgi:Alkylmercury lyase